MKRYWKIILVVIITISCNNLIEDMNKCEIIPGERFNNLELGDISENVLIVLKKDYNLKTKLKDLDEKIEPNDSMTLIFNSQLNVLSQIILHSSKTFEYQGVHIGESYDEVCTKLVLKESELEETLQEINGREGLWLEFDEDWKLDAFIIHNDIYSRIK